MSTPAATGPAPIRRLHPLTPLLRGANLAAIAVAAISWQGYRQLGTRNWLIAVGAVVVAVLIVSVIRWRVTGYRVVDRELRIYEGLIWRRVRAIPLERLQSVELVRSLAARMFKLAELRLEVVGAAKTEAPLSYLRQAEAVTLRAELLNLAYATRTASTPQRPPAPEDRATQPPDSEVPAGAAPAPTERLVHVVANRDLVVSQLLRPQWWLLPLAIAVPIYYLVTGSAFDRIAIASTVTAVVGAIQAPVRVLLGDWRFTVAAGTDGLRLRRGLIETRIQTVPSGRVQAVSVQWPLLWRGLRWVRVSMEIAGVAAGGGAGRGVQSGTLLPVGAVATARLVIAQALPGFELTSVQVHRAPRRAVLLAPLRWQVLGYHLGDAVVATQDGLLTRRLVCVPYLRIQSVRIHQGPVQRLLRLATVWADTAGGLAAMAQHRSLTEAYRLADELTERCRLARTRTR